MARPKKPTKFEEESAAANPETALATVDPGIRALFAAPPEMGVLEQLQRRNMPQMVKAHDKKGENIPVGGIISGVIVDVMPSPVTTIKGSLLWLHLVSFDAKGNPVKTGNEITFPATGTIRNALAPGVEGEENARKEMLKFKGHLFVAKRQPDKLNSKFQKDMFMFDVFTSPKPVDIGVKIH